MKKYFVIILLLVLSETTSACDICGCGAGSSYIGLLPEFSKKIVGIRYRYNSLTSHLGINGASTYLTTNEKYHTTELWGSITVGHKWRIMGTIPYNFNVKVNQGKQTSKSGISDISFSGFYQLLNHKSAAGKDKLLAQSLWIGAGIKLPTGTYSSANKLNASNASNLFQLGTGSTDFSLQLMYDIRLQDAGINFSSSYKINTINKEDYQYGNKLSSSVQTYYKFSLGKNANIAPNIGLLYERASVDIDKGFPVDASGGNILLGMAGFETRFNKISIGTNYQLPLNDQLGKGFVKAGNRFMAHFSLIF
ncbi:MAG: transporter [Ferruginibacter sp.]